RPGRQPAVDGLHDLAGHRRAVHRDRTDRDHAGRLRQHDRQPGRRPRARRDRGAGHAPDEPVAEVAVVVRDLHRGAVVEAERAVQAMTDRQVLVRDALILLALTGWAAALPAYAGEFVVSMALTCLMYVALSSSWSLFCGATRYLSLATSAFFGVGAYASALTLEQLPWAFAIALGAGVATLLAVVMGS